MQKSRQQTSFKLVSLEFISQKSPSRSWDFFVWTEVESNPKSQMTSRLPKPFGLGPHVREGKHSILKTKSPLAGTLWEVERFRSSPARHYKKYIILLFTVKQTWASSTKKCNVFIVSRRKVGFERMAS